MSLMSVVRLSEDKSSKMPPAKNPTRTILMRTYSINEEVADKTEDWSAPLWTYLESQVHFEVDTSVLRGDELAEILHERFINYVFARLVVGACHALKPHQKLPIGAEERQEALSDAV